MKMFEGKKVKVLLAQAGAGKTHRLIQEISKELEHRRPEEIAFVTFTRKGAEEGLRRVCNKLMLTPDDLPYFKTLHSLTFHALDFKANQMFSRLDEKKFNKEYGYNLNRNDVSTGKVQPTKDTSYLDYYDLERSGALTSKQIVEADIEVAYYHQLVQKYEEYKSAQCLVDFFDCLIKYVQFGDSLPCKVVMIDECFSPETKVRMADMTVKEIKDIKIGDYVMGTKGATKVISVCKGKDVMYDVMTGRKQKLFTCNSKHLILQKSKDNIVHTWKHCEDVKRRAEVFASKCTSDKSTDIKIDPYFFGLWLGNGFSREAVVVCNENDIETINYLKNYGEGLGDRVIVRQRVGAVQVEFSVKQKGLHLKCNVRKQLEQYGFMLAKTKENEKRIYKEKIIPEDFFNTSIENRLYLLAGLIDSDGMYVKAGNHYKYRIEMARKELMLNIYNLVASLGYLPNWYETEHTTNGVTRKYYRIDFFGSKDIPCLLKRKQFKTKPYDCFLPCRTVKKEEGDYVGITVDAKDNLFLLANGCVVHNCQDITALQWKVIEKAFANAEEIYLVGDENQCQPEGSKVLTREGYKNIEELKSSDCLVTFSQNDYAYYGLRNTEYHPEISHRQYKGTLYNVCVNGVTNRFTPNHRMIVRWFNRDTSLQCVYLMKKGEQFRVGQCQLFNSVGATHLIARMNNEQAEGCWILKVCKTKEEALVYEQYYSFAYGIPQISWKHWYTEEMQNKVYSLLGSLEDKASALLASVHRNINYPMFNHEKNQAKSGGTCISLCEACNLIPEVMQLPVYQGKSHTDKSSLWKGFSLTYEDYEGLVYSLNVPKYHTYVTEGGLTVHNCIYRYNGARPDFLINFAKQFEVEYLPKSHRLPRQVYNLAKAITDFIQEKTDKPFLFKEGNIEGNVTQLNNLDRLPNFITEPENKKTTDWYLLVRNNCYVEKLQKILEENLIPYWTNDGFFMGGNIMTRLKDYEGFKLEGYKSEEKREEFKRKFGIEDFSVPFTDTNLFSTEKKWIYEAYIEKYGLEKLKEMCKWTPQILISTIHQVKGGEADNVALLLDSTRRTVLNTYDNIDDELRVLYVGVTRAKKNLFLIDSTSKYGYNQIIEVIKDENGLQW